MICMIEMKCQEHMYIYMKINNSQQTSLYTKKTQQNITHLSHRHWTPHERQSYNQNTEHTMSDSHTITILTLLLTPCLSSLFQTSCLINTIMHRMLKLLILRNEKHNFSLSLSHLSLFLSVKYCSHQYCSSLNHQRHIQDGKLENLEICWAITGMIITDSVWSWRGV